jgi:hypothetical protein
LPTAVARLPLRVNQGRKSLGEPRNVRPTKRSEQLVNRAASPPYFGLALNNPGEHLWLLLALIDEEPIEVGNLNAVTSQWLFEVTAVECKEQLGIARNRQGANVNVLRVSRQGFNVEVISNLDGVDSAAREFPPHMANPCFGRLIREPLFVDQGGFGLTEQLVAPGQIEEARAYREATDQLVEDPREDDVRI